MGGAGNTWWDSDRTRFSTDYSLTYTIQNDVIDDGSGPEGFGGLRVSWDFRRQMTGTTAFTSVLAINENLDTIEDLRADFANALLVEISETLAFRTSLKLLFDNLPSRTTVPLEQPAGTPTGGSVRVPLDKLDRVFTVALVASF